MTVDRLLEAWSLTPDGPPHDTATGCLLPVRRHGVPAVLKIARVEEERRGGRLMAWWNGDGAARVLAADAHAVLLERLDGADALAILARTGEDERATDILCAVAARLHAPRPGPLPDLVPLAAWFAALGPAAAAHGGRLADAHRTAVRLLAERREPVVLHGDLHHGNVLDGGARGWLALDPKGLHGERTFEFVNLLRNPDAATALAPGRFDRRVDRIARSAGLDRCRLLAWTLAFCGLSAAWHLADGTSPALDLAVADLAAARLDPPEDR